MSRPDTPSSAPPRMTSFTPEHSSEPRFRPNGTAVYELPSSLLDMPRATMNERPNTNAADRKVSFEDDAAGKAPNRHYSGHPGNTGARDSTMPSPTPTRASPGLSRLPSIRHQRTDSARELPRDYVKPDHEHAAREFAREAARRQKAEAEASLRRQEDLEAAEDKQLDLEAERARNRRPLFAAAELPRRRPESLFSNRDSLDNDHSSSWSRHTSPPAPPRLPRPAPATTGTRFASASPLPTSSRSSLRRSGTTHGRATIHHYHYPDSPPVVTSSSNNSSRRPSDSIRERGREVIERERVRAAAEDLRRAVEEGAGADMGAGARRWEPVFDEVEERVSGREYYYVSEGPARQEIRRRHGSWRDEKKRDFWS